MNRGMHTDTAKWASHHLYIARDELGAVLYVGCTGNVERRMKAHKGKSPWWKHHASLDIYGPFRYRDALRMEQEWIWTLAPIFNRPLTADFYEFGLDNDGVTPLRPVAVETRSAA